MFELGQTAEALPLMNGSHVYGGVGSDEVRIHSLVVEYVSQSKHVHVVSP